MNSRRLECVKLWENKLIKAILIYEIKLLLLLLYLFIFLCNINTYTPDCTAGFSIFLFIYAHQAAQSCETLDFENVKLKHDRKQFSA